MPYVLPATFDTLPRALRISPAEWAANSSSAPLPGVPRRARTNLPANVRTGFTYGTPSQNEHGPSTSAASSSPGSPTPTPADMLALASPTTALLHVSQSTPLPCLALPRARRVRREADVVFPSAEPDASANYVLAPPEPKHQPINGKNGLRLSLDAIKATLSGNTEPPRPKPTTTPTPSLRKKSGELVKPSLKHAHTLSGGLPTQKSMSRSMPTTPTAAKFVHFDAQLEHVRLFLAEQKPTAVSRDGSPIDTSEGEGTEFPWNGRGYGSSDDERAKKSLRVKSTNVPPNPSLDGADVRVQSLTLSEDGSSLVGRVLVRNIAFEKWVAARFTFDWWQTTSEVSARYIDTVADGVDRFGFTIKLGDVMHRIEEKTLYVAVRYTVEGREIWDSNHGQNYMVSFTKDKANNLNGWSTKSRTRDQMSDLRKSLERAIQDDEDGVPQLQIKSRPRPSVRGMSFSGFEKPSVASIVGKPEPKAEKFGARYDFGAAPRERPSADAFRMPELKRPEPKPAKRPVVSTELPRPIAKLCESPRDAEDMVGLRMVEPLVRSNGLDLPSPADPVPIPRRHHHRASYFDTWTFPAPGVKRTVSGPAAEDESKDMGIPASWMAGTDMGADLFGGSVASTPSVTSASSPSQSPSSPPEFLPSPEIISEIDLGCGPKAVEPHNPNMNYSSFLDQFCFFTGPHPSDSFTRPSDNFLYGGYSDATARTLRAVSSSLSNCSSDASASNTPRAGSPAHLARAGSPASSDSAH